MTLSELVLELRDIVLAHPESAHATVEARDILGRLRTNVGVRLKAEDHVVIIDGGS